MCFFLHYGCEFLTGRGACQSGGLRNFWSENAVRPCGLPIRLILPPHTTRRYGGQPVDIAPRRFLSVSWASCNALVPTGFVLVKNDHERSARRRRKHCALAVVRRSQKFCPTADLLPTGEGRPKFNQLEMVTTFTCKPSLVSIDARNFELSW